MSDAYRDQSVKERVRCLILDQVVGEDPCRLVGPPAAKAARLQVIYQITQRRIFPNKPATSFPGNEVDMDIRLDYAQCPRGSAPRSCP